MNLVTVHVIKVIVEPYQKEDGMWSTTVITDCWGREEEKTVTGDTKQEIEKYKVGYNWEE